MTILNVWLNEAQASVAVDTVSAQSDISSGGEMSKLLVLPHANVVFAARGSMDWLRWTFEFFHHKPYDMDSIERDIAVGLATARRFLLSRMAAERVKLPLALELVVVGWSAARNSIVGLRSVVDADGIAATSIINGWVMAPWDLAALGEPRPSRPDDAELLSVAGRQLAHYRPLYPNAGFGGRLIVAEITRGSMVIRDVGTLDLIPPGGLRLGARCYRAAAAGGQAGGLA